MDSTRLRFFVLRNDFSLKEHAREHERRYRLTRPLGNLAQVALAAAFFDCGCAGTKAEHSEWDGEHCFLSKNALAEEAYRCEIANLHVTER